ncbi:hypothetical protein [Helicobacter suis]|uniref:putative barnase/colicin E5 family endoribonuclease n=1 Tax=Helicobacter suis TaxID=104628 RepID=UPI0013D43274|nr:hypothetical protein [Helicobacter suis]
MECISVLCGFFTRYFFISLAFVFFSEKAPNILAETFKAKTFPNQLRQKATKVPLKNQEIPHNPAFGQNFKEFYHNPKGAIAKLIETKEGQVAGAFYRKDLGDIDLVWGEIRDQSGKLKGHGLAKIVEKHLDDFKGFEGNSALEKLGNGLEEIVREGDVVKRVGREDAYNITHKGFIVGINKGYDKQGNNYWIVTAFDRSKPIQEKTIRTARVNDLTKEPNNPSLNSKDISTTPPLKNQDRPYQVITDKEAFIKNLDLSAYATPVPKELDVKAFLKSLEGVENKENFIKHLQAKEDAQSTLAYLNLVEPTLKSPDIKLTKGNRTELIKRFIDENDKFFALPITQDADKKLITFIPKARLKYLQDKIRNADLIQTFNGRAGD